MPARDYDMSCHDVLPTTKEINSRLEKMNTRASCQPWSTVCQAAKTYHCYRQCHDSDEHKNTIWKRQAVWGNISNHSWSTMPTLHSPFTRFSFIIPHQGRLSVWNTQDLQCLAVPVITTSRYNLSHMIYTTWRQQYQQPTMRQCVYTSTYCPTSTNPTVWVPYRYTQWSIHNSGLYRWT